MKDIQQLIKKNSQEGRYEDIFPKTFIDAVLDKESGVTLTDILAMFNMLFLSYNGSRSQTRLQVPSSLRREGLWVTYVLYDKTVVTEWYSAEAIDDTTFGDSANWRDGSNALVGDISISSDGYRVINGEVTNIKAQGEAGITPILRVGSNNHLQVSYTNGSTYVDVSPNPVFTQFRVSNNKLQQSTDLGESWSNISEELAYKFRESGNKIQMSKDLGNTWEDVSDYIAAWFRFTGTTGSSQADNVGKIQISRDNGATWSDLSGEFTNSLHIKGYVATVGALPSTAVQGDIYGVGPTYDPSDTEQTNPIYQLYVKDSTGWVNNGRFTSIAAGVVQTTGTSTTEVMSQDAVTRELTDLELGVIYDVSAHNDGAVFESLQALLSSSSLSTLIPTSVRCGGMSIRFIQGSVPNSDNKYVQYRLLAQNFTTATTQWQGIDDEPTAGSENLVKSGGVTLQAVKDISANINGSTLPLPTIYQKNFDDNGNYINSDIWCSSQIVYLRKGTIIDVTNSNYRIFVRRWESIISDTTCDKIGYVDIFPYVMPADGYYGFSFIHLNNAAITIAEVESNYSLSYPAAKTTDNTPLIYVGDYVSINNVNQLRNIFWKRNKNNNNYILSIPFNKGSKAELAISASGIQSGIQTRYSLKKNGTELTHISWSNSFLLYNFKYDCDTIEIYFSLYDGTSLSVFDTSSINTIIESISSIDIQTKNYRDDIPFASEQYVKMLNEQVEKNSHANILLGNEVSDIVPVESMTYNNDGTLYVNSSFSVIYPIYLPFGAKLAFTSPLTHLYVRAYRNNVTQANLVVSQYVDNGFECPFSGWYLLSFRKSNGYPSSSEITNNFTILNRGIANNYNKYTITELNKSLGTLISGNKNLEFIFPAKQFFAVKVLLNTGNNVQVYIFHEKDGTIVSGAGSFGLGWDYEGYGFICERECDNIHIRFRIYDGTSLSTLTDTEITTIINSIKLLHVQTYDYKQTVGTDAQYYLQDNKYKLCKNNIKSICHQGLYHFSLAGGYYAAALAGFDYGETDVKMTSDNIPVCCHDDTFVDENTQSIITISQHTLAELKTYNYHGGKIASLEEIIRECKTSGIGLALDQVNTASVELTETIKLLKKYNMTNNVIWIASGPVETIKGWCSFLYTALPNAVVEFALSNIDNDTIQFANSLNDDGHKIIISFNKDAISVQQLIAVSENINAEIERSMWTIDEIENYKSYFPFVNYITSNCLSYRLYIQGFGIENL